MASSTRVRSIVAVAGVVCATMLDAGMPIWSVVIVGLLIGATLGAINGVVIVIGRVPPFIMTLGMMVIGRGLAMTISGGHPVHFREAAESFSWLGQGFLLGLPVPVWVFLLVAASAFFVLRYTPFGRNIYAVGSNPEAARLSGINVGATIFGVYLISGFRWAFYGQGDVAVGISLAATLGFFAVCLAIVMWMFKTGYRLKN
ncbi:MAG: ABC transporter permease [Proteobacteria bacterium]|nr:ABC transporter permease [Pseudomonadota bacterium]